MAKEIKITCDGCGRVKQETNRWWTVHSMHLSNGEPYVVIQPTGSSNGDWPVAVAKDFCGEQCALKFISEQMGKVGQ